MHKCELTICINSLLLHHLARQDGFSCCMTKKQIYRLLGMANENFTNQEFKAKKEKELQSTNKQISKFQLNNFYFRCNQKLDKILITALRNLKNRCLISYCEQYIAVPNNNMHESYVLDDFEVADVDAVKKKVLNSMGFTNLIQMYSHYKEKEFYDKVNLELLDLYDWCFVYKQYKIIFTRNNVIEELPKNKLELQKLFLNEKIIEALDIQAEIKYNKQLSKWEEEYNRVVQLYALSSFHPSPDDMNYFRFPDCYIEIQKQLSKEFLAISFAVEQSDFIGSDLLVS